MNVGTAYMEKGANYMECREFESNIPGFITGELPDEKYDDFIGHYNSCSECNEELEILYLVHNTINSDDLDNESFNLKEKLKIHMKNMEDMVYKRYKCNFFRRLLLSAAQLTAYGAGVVFILKLLGVIN